MNIKQDKKKWKKPQIIIISKKDIDKFIIAAACSTLASCKALIR